jgi:hypothetical protein
MLLNIILVIIILFFIYKNLKVKESFDYNVMFVQSNISEPTCSSDLTNCISSISNDMNAIYRYTDNNNFKAKQSAYSVLKPYYLF